MKLFENRHRSGPLPRFTAYSSPIPRGTFRPRCYNIQISRRRISRKVERVRKQCGTKCFKAPTHGLHEFFETSTRRALPLPQPAFQRCCCFPSIPPSDARLCSLFSFARRGGKSGARFSRASEFSRKKHRGARRFVLAALPETAAPLSREKLPRLAGKRKLGRGVYGIIIFAARGSPEMNSESLPLCCPLNALAGKNAPTPRSRVQRRYTGKTRISKSRNESRVSLSEGFGIRRRCLAFFRRSAGDNVGHG